MSKASFGTRGSEEPALPSAPSPAGGEAATSLDMRDQFMATLSATLARLAEMYPECPRTARHVGEFMKHAGEARTRERSIKMWHKAMEAHYVAISQTRDAARRDAAMLAGLRANWFMAGLGMAEKWAEPAFEPSRERFLQTIRVLNGLAFLQHSFLGKLAGALSQMTERLAAKAGSSSGGMDAAGVAGLLDDPSLPELLALIQPDTLHEINRMLPHVTHVLGGKERLLTMLDQTLGEEGPMRGVLDQLLGAMLGGEAGGEAGGAAGEGAPPPSAAAALSSSGFAATLREIIERVSDPDNDTAFTDTLASLGLDLSGAAGGAEGEAGGTPAPALSADDIRAAFEGFRDQFGEGSLSGLLESAEGGISVERLSAMAAGFLGDEANGGGGGEEASETVSRLSAVLSALQRAAGGGGASGEGGIEAARRAVE